MQMKRYLTLLLAVAACGLLPAGCVRDDSNNIEAEATCHCDYYENGTTNYTVNIYLGTRRNSGEFRKAGEMVCLDFIAAGDAPQNALPEGTYALDTDNDLQPGDMVPSEAFTMREYFQQWIDAGYNIDLSDYSDLDLDVIAGYSGTAYYSQTNTKDGENHPVSQASMTITRNGKQYLISASVTVDGVQHEFTYEGELSVDIQEPQKPLTEGVTAMYCGDYYSILADNWTIRVNLPDKEALFLDVLKKAETFAEVPEGTFTCSSTPAPGTLIPGQVDDQTGMVEGSCAGRWNGTVSMLVSQGTVTLTPSADRKTCRVDYSVSGDDPLLGGEKEGTFTGPLTLIDGTLTASVNYTELPINLKNLKAYGSKKTLQKAARPDDSRRL